MLARARAAMGPEPLEEILGAGKSLPEDYRTWPPARMLQFVRCRLKFTQHELACKAGLAPSQISRLEAGKDCLLSTWTRAYAALGVELRLMPVSTKTADELELLAAETRDPYENRRSLRPHGPWFLPRRQAP